MADQPSISGHNAEAHKNTPEIPELTLTMPVDAAKIEAIKRCIQHGQLRVTLNKVNLAGSRLSEAYIYD
jgi:anti-sigma28 factor (negative regulator of flagellin synthesis)